jgi:ferredoxin
MNDRPHPKNVPSPFYVKESCCSACGIAERVAPDLFTFAEDGHCYVRKQPCTQQEADRMFDAMSCQEFDCIRYRGRDSYVLQRLDAMGNSALCDFPAAEGIAVVRDSDGT